MNFRFCSPQGIALIGGEVIGNVETRDGIPVIIYPNSDTNEVESHC